jgi:4,5-dihydroxyphthalate decarboxylase
LPTLRASFVPSPLTQAIIDGSVRPSGLEFDFSQQMKDVPTSTIIEANSKKMVAFDLDVAEMSFGTFTRARDLRLPVIGLPVFPGRRFLQPAMAVRKDSEIDSPAELRGKRAAVGQFWQTAFVWHRLILNTMYGIRQEEMSWVCTAPERWDQLPEPKVPVRLDTTGRDPVALLRDGEVDVAFIANGSGLLDLAASDSVRPLFTDRAGAQADYFKKTHIFPMIHLLVLQEKLAEDASVVAGLCEAFLESKRRGMDKMIGDPLGTPILGGDPSAVRPLFGDDPWPYGIAPNRMIFETYLRDVHEHQRLTDRQLQVSDLFAKNLPPTFA